MDDLLFRASVAAVRRLYKAKLRLHISRLMAESEGPRWQPLVEYEEGLRQEAQLAWDLTRTSWASASRPEIANTLIRLALERGLLQARHEVFVHFYQQEFDPRWVRDRILEYGEP